MLNLGHDLDASELASWPHVKGIFGPNDSMEKLCQGLSAIISGENWLSRRLLDQLVNYYKGKRGAPRCRACNRGRVDQKRGSSFTDAKRRRLEYGDC